MIITTSRPISRIFAIASALDGLGMSATAMIPADRPSTATNIGVFPRVASASEVAASAPSPMPRSLMSAPLPRSTCFPPIRDSIPRPGSAWNASSGSADMPRSSARFTIASPSGCSEPFSAEAASWSSASSLNPSVSTMSVTTGAPSVMVPVLSSTTIWMRWASSRAAPPLMRMPFSAPLPVPTMMAVGVARPSAQGQAMTSTAVKMVMLNTTLWPLTSQAAPARRAISMTIGTKYPETTSASCAIGAFEPCACSTSLTIWASAVSAPTRVARKVMVPFLLMLAPVTGSPAFFSTGMLSPVSMDSSTEV